MRARLRGTETLHFYNAARTAATPPRRPRARTRRAPHAHGAAFQPRGAAVLRGPALPPATPRRKMAARLFRLRGLLRAAGRRAFASQPRSAGARRRCEGSGAALGGCGPRVWHGAAVRVWVGGEVLRGCLRGLRAGALAGLGAGYVFTGVYSVCSCVGVWRWWVRVHE